MKTQILSTIAAALLTALVILIAGCGGNSTSNTGTAAPQSMVKKDVAADDGEGIGKFKNVALASFDAALAAEGKKAFEAKCSACHKTTEQKIVGPGLKDITKRRKPAWILNMITNPEEMTKKDPTAMKLLEEHLTQMTFQNVSDDEAKALLEFFRENDGEGASAQN